jgi:hypothetical protein
MATEKEIYEIIGRAVADPEFRKRLIADPKATAQESGYTLTDEQVALLKSAEGEGLASLLEDRLPKDYYIVI